MKLCQMGAQNVPPNARWPWTLRIGIEPFEYPIQTAVTSCGV